MSSLSKNFHFVRLSTNTKLLLCGCSNQGLDQPFGEVLLHEWADTVTACCCKASQWQTQDSNPAPEMPSGLLFQPEAQNFLLSLVFKTHTKGWSLQESPLRDCWLGVQGPDLGQGVIQHEIPEGDKSHDDFYVPFPLSSPDLRKERFY